MALLRRRIALPLLFSLGLGARLANPTVVVIIGADGAPGIDGSFPSGAELPAAPASLPSRSRLATPIGRTLNG